MDAGDALDELSRFSTEIRSAAIVDVDGNAIAQTPGADGGRLARTATELLELAAAADTTRAVARVEVRRPGGSVFVVRVGAHAAIATAAQEAPAALVVHDLRACLGRVGA